MMRRLTRRGRLTVTLVVAAVALAAALTWTCGSALFVGAYVFFAGVIAVGAAMVVDDLDHAVRHRRIVVGGRRRWE